MTALKGNGEFGFPETLDVSGGEAEGNIEGRTKLTVSRWTRRYVFSYTSQVKKKERKKTATKVFASCWLAQIRRGSKLHDLITYKSKVQVVVTLAKELVSFVRPGELVSFDP